jgi:uncharacterized membrane protein
VPAGRDSIAGGASIILLGLAPVLAYHVVYGWAPAWVVGVVTATQAMAITWLLTGKWTSRYRAAVLMGVLAVTVAVMMELPVRATTLAVAGGCHAIAYLALLIWFGRSLQPGREPVVTGLARRMRREMPDKVVRYTRQVTIAWCVFFSAQLAVSAVLLLAAPQAVWSAFVNLLNLPLLMAMVLAEFSYRLILFRHEPHSSLIDTLSAMRHARFTPANRP